MSDSRMRCSECKSFRMCVFNPEGKDGEPETYGCFNFSAGGEEQNTPVGTGIEHRITIWRFLLCIGIVGIIASLILMAAGCGSNQESLIYALCGVILLITSVLISVVSSSEYFLEKGMGKRRNNKGAGDSRSE